MSDDIQIIEYADADPYTRTVMDSIIKDVLSDSDNAVSYGGQPLAIIGSADKAWGKLVPEFTRAVDAMMKQMAPFKENPRFESVPELKGVTSTDYQAVIDTFNKGVSGLAFYIGTASEITRKKNMTPVLAYRIEVLKASFDAAKKTRDQVADQMGIVVQLEGGTERFKKMKEDAIEAERAAAQKIAEEKAAAEAAKKAAAEAKKAKDKKDDASAEGDKKNPPRRGYFGRGWGSGHTGAR